MVVVVVAAKLTAREDYLPEGQTDRSTDRHRLNRQARLNKVASESFNGFVRSRGSNVRLR